MGEAHTDLRKEATDMSHELSMGFLVKGKGSELLGKKNTTYIHSWCDVRKLYKHMMDGWTWTGFCTICKDPEFVYEESHCLYNPILGMGFRPSILNRERSGLLGVVCTPNMSDEILTGLQHKTSDVWQNT